jgi:hypothetical protein
MAISSSMLNELRNYPIYIVKIFHSVCNYLSGYEPGKSNNRVLLRRLYNAGYLDDGKYQDLCEKSSNDNLDPEELPM